MEFIMEFFAGVILLLFFIILCFAITVFIYSKVLDSKETRKQLEKEIENDISKRNKNHRKTSKKSTARKNKKK